jgi:hypothetical protein
MGRQFEPGGRDSLIGSGGRIMLQRARHQLDDRERVAEIDDRLARCGGCGAAARATRCAASTTPCA